MSVKLIKFTFIHLALHIRQNLVIFAIYSIIMSLFCSFFMLAESVKHEQSIYINGGPDMFVQRFSGGRVLSIPEKWALNIGMILGVSEVGSRVVGSYHFEKTNNLFTIVGVDFFGPSTLSHSLDQFLARGVELNSFLAKNSMIVGRGVESVMENNYYSDFINFVTPDRVMVKIFKYGVFDQGLELETNDMILLSMDLARKVVGIPKGEVSLFTVRLSQKRELGVVAKKIRELYPSTYILSKEQIIKNSEGLINYKSGLFILLMMSSLLAFSILLFFKATSMSQEDRRLVAVMRSTGWGMEHVLKWKVLDAFILSSLVYLFSFLISALFVFNFNAPFLSEILLGRANLSADYNFTPYIDYGMVVLFYLTSTTLYLIASYIPAWRLSTMDCQEVLR